ncbi:hypothetical protein [Paenibacillus sp. Marseille-Q4541]|uniref:hypothetical protein n=1 Tax=Paenibacillus sp. Marseille-Q4541 TaxID=2831522 RepID=UPI001BABEE08|nr:hypothetical protein [Paenibacillus sp. Marseille-Q4541]
MYVIQNAKITKAMELNGVSCVEVAVEPAQAGDPSLLLYITGSKDGSNLELHRVVRNHHDLTLDWYNNNVSAAFEDSTEFAFENTGDITAEQEKEGFMKALLNYSSMNQELRSKLLK